MDGVKRAGLAAALVLGVLSIGFAVGGVPDIDGSTAGRMNYTVTGLLEDASLEDNVVVEANVSSRLPDYTSDSGNTYQQFYVTDGRKEVKVFCSTNGGRTNLTRGERVRVAGKFQEFYGEYEIYTRCSSIRPE